MRFQGILLAFAIAAISTVASSALFPESAAAQCTGASACTSVRPDVKGTIGLGLIGAELGFVIPAAAGLHETWAFIVFPTVGAVGGALGGYFGIEQGTKSAELSVATLAVGIGLVIPALVLTLQLTSDTGGNSVSDQTDELSASSDDNQTGEVSDASDRSLRASNGTGALRITPQGLFLGVPVVSSVPVFTAEEMQSFGLRQNEAETRISLISGEF